MPDPAKSPLLLQDAKLDWCDQASVHQGLVVRELVMVTIDNVIGIEMMMMIQDRQLS